MIIMNNILDKFVDNAISIMVAFVLASCLGGALMYLIIKHPAELREARAQLARMDALGAEAKLFTGMLTRYEKGWFSHSSDVSNTDLMKQHANVCFSISADTSETMLNQTINWICSNQYILIKEKADIASLHFSTPDYVRVQDQLIDKYEDLETVLSTMLNTCAMETGVPIPIEKRDLLFDSTKSALMGLLNSTAALRATLKNRQSIVDAQQAESDSIADAQLFESRQRVIKVIAAYLGITVFAICAGGIVAAYSTKRDRSRTTPPTLPMPRGGPTEGEG